MRTNTLRCAQWWKLVAQIGMTQLHNPFRPWQVAQGVCTKIGQPRVGRKRVDDQILNSAGEHALATVSEIA